MYVTDCQKTYYPHIDGIRTFAVLSVLLYHVFPEWCTGGFIGVDVFFVISGYLITKGLYRDLQSGEFSISRFYVRRIRRIFPAYAVMVLFTVLVGFFLYEQTNVRTLLRTAVSSVFFCSNIFFQYNSGYFDEEIQNNPLLNMWSLSIEEQFYIFLPVLLALLFIRAHKWINFVFILILIISLLSGCYLIFVAGSSTAAFYGLPFRAWELMAGSLLALGSWQLSKNHWWIGILALLILNAAFFLYNAAMPFPGITALLPVGCAILLIQCGNLGMCSHVFEHPLTVFIGKISYSLYLFHWPLLVYSLYLFEGLVPRIYIQLSVVVLSLLFGILSWRYIETPVRLTRWSSRRYFIFAGSGIGVLVAVIAGVWWASRHFSSCIVEPYWNGSGTKCYEEPNWEKSENSLPDSLITLGKDECPRYLLWGDSHAMALSPGFHKWSLANGINGLYVNRKHVLLYKGMCRDYPHNAFWVDSILQWIKRHPEINNIILVNRWAVRAQGFCNESPLKKIHYSLQGASLGAGPSEIFDLGLSSLCEELQRLGRNVIIFSSIPEQKTSVPVQLKKSQILGIPAGNLSVSFKEYALRQKEVIQTLQKLEKKGLAHIIWVDDFFYPQEKSRILLEGNRSLYVDDDHLSPSGARLLLHHLSPRLKQSLK